MTIDRASALIQPTDRRGSAAPMRISFLVNEVHGGWSPTSRRLGGTEESVVEWARRLRRRGHDVTIFHNGEHGIWEGVAYAPREDHAAAVADVTINVKCSEIAPAGPTLYFTNETDVASKDVSRYDGVVLPSFWARDNLRCNNERVFVLYHGYDPTEIYPGTKYVRQCLYASSPNRGLAELLDVWRAVVRRVPDATLFVTYGVSGAIGPNALGLGDVDRATMNELFRTSDVWVHPCSGGELFGMTGVKAQVAGCIPVYYPTMALAETVQAGIKSKPRTLADDLVRALTDDELRLFIRKSLAEKHFVDWEESTDELERLLLACARR